MSGRASPHDSAGSCTRSRYNGSTSDFFALDQKSPAMGGGHVAWTFVANVGSGTDVPARTIARTKATLSAETATADPRSIRRAIVLRAVNDPPP